MAQKKIKPLEADKEKKDGVSYLKSISKIVLKYQEGAPELTQVLWSKVKGMFCRPEPLSTADVEELVRIANTPEKKGDVTDFVELFNQFVKNVHERSQAFAENALKQTGAGVITMGTRHGPEVIQNLKKLCGNSATEAVPLPKGGSK